MADGTEHDPRDAVAPEPALRASRAQTAALEDELALERRVLSEVVERVPLGITLLWGRELRYHVMNEQGRRMLPDRGPLVGRTPAEVYPETAETFAATVVPLFDSGQELVIRGYPLPFDDDDGALDGHRLYDVTFTPISLEPGTVVGVLVAYVDVTSSLRRERELEQELAEERHVSATLQQAILPRRLPVVPHLEVAARYRAAGARYEVGGDFYGLFAARGGRWLAVVGDVCGKGPRAAARTSMVRYCLRAEAAHSDDPAELLALLNTDVRRELAQQEEEDFVTVVLAILEPTAAGTQLRIATAAHPAAIIAAPDGSWRTLGGPGLPVGVADDARYVEHAGLLAPGERLVLHTDGLLDAHAPDVTLTTADLAARTAVPGGAEAIADAVLHHVTSSPVPARDDCAVLVLAQQD